MAWNGWTVIDMDSHIMERPHEMYGDYMDPEHREKFGRFKRAIEENIRKGGPGSIASSRGAVVAPVLSDNALGDADTFGLVGREFILHPTSGRANFGRPERGELPMIRKEASWDAAVRIEDMDASHVDVDVLYPTHVSSYCALRDPAFENGLYRAYHRWVSDFCSQAPDRLKWTLVANMRDARSAVEEVRHWAEADPNMVGIYFSPQGPDNMLLDDQRLGPHLRGGPGPGAADIGPRGHGAAALRTGHLRPAGSVVPATRPVQPLGWHGGHGRASSAGACWSGFPGCGWASWRRLRAGFRPSWTVSTRTT